MEHKQGSVLVSSMHRETLEYIQYRTAYLVRVLVLVLAALLPAAAAGCFIALLQLGGGHAAKLWVMSYGSRLGQRKQSVSTSRTLL